MAPPDMPVNAADGSKATFASKFAMFEKKANESEARRNSAPPTAGRPAKGGKGKGARPPPRQTMGRRIDQESISSDSYYTESYTESESPGGSSTLSPLAQPKTPARFKSSPALRNDSSSRSVSPRPVLNANSTPDFKRSNSKSSVASDGSKKKGVMGTVKGWFKSPKNKANSRDPSPSHSSSENLPEAHLSVSSIRSQNSGLPKTPSTPVVNDSRPDCSHCGGTGNIFVGANVQACPHCNGTGKQLGELSPEKLEIPKKKSSSGMFNMFSSSKDTKSRTTNVSPQVKSEAQKLAKEYAAKMVAEKWSPMYENVKQEFSVLCKQVKERDRAFKRTIAKQKLEIARLSIELGKANRKARRNGFDADEERAETNRLRADLKLAAVRAEEDRMFLQRCKRLLLEVMVILPDDEPFKVRQAQVLQDPLMSDIADRARSGYNAAERAREDELFEELSDRVNDSPIDTAARVRQSFGHGTPDRSRFAPMSRSASSKIRQLLT